MTIISVMELYIVPIHQAGAARNWIQLSMAVAAMIIAANYLRNKGYHQTRLTIGRMPIFASINKSVIRLKLLFFRLALIK